MLPDQFYTEPYEVLYENDAQGRPMYRGLYVPDVNVNATDAVFRIIKWVYDANGNLTGIFHANHTTSYTNKWSERANYEYGNNI
jgi:YD repeat-containing protein